MTHRSFGRLAGDVAPVALLLVALAAIHAPALAQDDPRGSGEQILPPIFEFSFSNPGARSMGFGGAFVALADDATAAFANPAGLVQLVEPEVSVEGRRRDYTTPFVRSGRLVGEATGIGLDQEGLRTGRSREELGGLSFLSFVWPKKRWSLAFYRHQLADFEYSGEVVGLFSGPWPEAGVGLRREATMHQRTDLEITSHAVAVAYRWTETLSVGATFSVFSGDLTTVTESYGHACGGDILPPCPPDPTFFFARRVGPSDLAEAAALSIDDTTYGLSAGFLWDVSGGWKLGGAYRQGPELDLDYAWRAGPANVFEPPGATAGGNFGQVSFPDVLALGVSYRTPGQRLTLALEWDRVGYSDFARVFGVRGIELEDGDEVRFGFEYVVAEATPVVALRMGLWHDPDHRIRYRGANYLAAGMLRGGADENHLALGVGLAFAKMKIDLGFDISKPVDTLSLSTIYTF